MAQVALYDESGWSYGVDPGTHTVATPARATDRQSAEAMAAMKANLSGLGSVIGVGIFLLLIVLGLALLATWFPSLSIVASVAIGGLLLIIIFSSPRAVAALFKFGVSAIGYLVFSRRPPNLSTPERTVACFFNALGSQLYRRAYNCLTDQAQTMAVEFPRDHPIQRSMPAASWDSAESFGAFWSGLVFSWQPQLSGAMSYSINDDAVKMEVPVLCRWTQAGSIVTQDAEVKAPDGSPNDETQTVSCPFLVVRRSGYWFLCNGAFWPFPSSDQTVGRVLGL